VIWETAHFVALVPYAARAPHEAWILPRQHACSYEEALMPESVADLASLLGGYFRTLARVLGDPSFEMTLNTAPNRNAKVLPGEWATVADDYHWHIEVTPQPERLTRVGGIYVNETPPEEAAQRLREAWS